MNKFTFRASDNIRAVLIRKSKEQNLSLSAFIRNVIEEGLYAMSVNNETGQDGLNKQFLKIEKIAINSTIESLLHIRYLVSLRDESKVAEHREKAGEITQEYFQSNE